MRALATYLAILTGMLLGFPGVASALSSSVLPVVRPVRAAAAAPEFAVFLSDVPGLRTSLRPVARPAGKAEVTRQAPRAVQVASSAGIVRSLRPQVRPNKPRQRETVVAASFVATKPTVKFKKTRKGSVCGSRTIRGQKLSPIQGKFKGCGISEPVRVTSIDGVALSQPSTMDCGTAQALESWVQNGVKPTINRLGGGVASLQVIAHYSCRTRNSKSGAKISEHGKGRAVDVSAINLKNGVSISVAKGWRDPTQGKLLKAMQTLACGPFGTVLGPKSDRYHQDHFHLDTARYRSGTYCR